MWIAPTMIRCAGRRNGSMNQSPSRRASSVPGGVPSTSSDSPVTRFVRRVAGSSFSSMPINCFCTASEGLDEHLDVAATGKPNLEGNVVGDAESRDLRLARLQDLLRLFEDGALDAPVGDRAGHLARARHHHPRAERPRARAPRLDHRGERDLLARLVPRPQLVEDLPHVRVPTYTRGDDPARTAAGRGRRGPARCARPGSRRSKAARQPCRASAARTPRCRGAGSAR